MKKVLILFAVVSIYFMSSEASAYENENVAVGKLTWVGTIDGGKTIIQVEAGASNTFDPAGRCNGHNYMTFDNTTEGGKSMLSMALAAYVSGKSVRVVIHDDICLTGSFKVYRIDLANWF